MENHPEFSANTGRIIIAIQPSAQHIGTTMLALRIRNILEFYNYTNVSVKDMETTTVNQERGARLPNQGALASDTIVHIEDYVPGAYKAADLHEAIQARRHVLHVSVVPSRRQAGATTIRQIIAEMLCGFHYNHITFGGDRVCAGILNQLLYKAKERRKAIATPVEIRVLPINQTDHTNLFAEEPAA